MVRNFDLTPTGGEPANAPAPAVLLTMIDALNKAASLVTANYVAAMAVEDVLMGKSSLNAKEPQEDAPPPSGAFPYMIKVVHEIIALSSGTADINRRLLRGLGRAQAADEIS